jgi:uncharacterized membrane protein
MSAFLLMRLASALIFVGLVHGAALSGRPALGVLAFLLVCLSNIVINRLTAGTRRALLVWSALAGLMLLMLMGTLQGFDDLAKIILLPPVVLNGFFLYIFGRTLLPGREPLITRMRRLDSGEVAPELAAYTRRLSIYWVVFFAVSLVVSILLALYADLATWSWVTNFAGPATGLAFFLLEHLYRVYRFGHSPPVSIVATLRATLRPDAWTVET